MQSPRTFAALALALALALAAPPAGARDLLGVFGTWAAFRDPAVPRCYAIAQSPRTPQAYADIGDWPAKNLRGQVHIHLARRLAPRAAVALSLGGQHFHLVAGGTDAWAADRRMDAAIVAALRSAPAMSAAARDATGHLFTAIWPLDGAATAIDAALVGCAKVK